MSSLVTRARSRPTIRRYETEKFSRNGRQNSQRELCFRRELFRTACSMAPNDSRYLVVRDIKSIKDRKVFRNIRNAVLFDLADHIRRSHILSRYNS